MLSELEQGKKTKNTLIITNNILHIFQTSFNATILSKIINSTFYFFYLNSNEWKNILIHMHTVWPKRISWIYVKKSNFIWLRIWTMFCICIIRVNTFSFYYYSAIWFSSIKNVSNIKRNIMKLIHWMISSGQDTKRLRILTSTKDWSACGWNAMQ